MPMNGDLEGERVIVSIVSSEGYDADVEDHDVLVYTGHGGNASGFLPPNVEGLCIRWPLQGPRVIDGEGACLARNSSCCFCIKKNEGDLPCTSYGILVRQKSMIYECGSMCASLPNWKYRVTETGFKDGRDGESNEYVFHTNRVYEPFKWNYEIELLGEESSDTVEDYDIPSPLTISSKNSGNVARFMNHSCSSNVFCHPIMYEHNNEVLLHIVFFAKRHIPSITELTYDYVILHSDESESNKVDYGKNKCLCG
ncbi:Heat shock protein 70 (Hsp 70) family protein isoform 1 [Hibiscus syriacus]|uniref:Heat shock protein 70 (Hsp 70) family protein isoform 1 n=1 Tax=Hibiscus syriacus TaxID=106335 RepID=A0A6A3BPN0_HIBSY|nr:Heat shock protein 70 (Hsp 70) family protein isoform 1 [Hibiscus syriacus]